MNRKKIKTIIKVVAVIVCIAFLLASTVGMIFSLNVVHEIHCKYEECPVCLLIQIATTFVQTFNYICKYFIILSIIMPLIYLKSVKYFKEKYATLIDWNVIKIE